MNEAFLVTKQLESDLYQIDQEIEHAINTKKKIETTRDGKAIVEDLRIATNVVEVERRIENPDLEIILLEEYIKSENEVITKHSHLYPILIRKALEKCFVDFPFLVSDEKTTDFEKKVQNQVARVLSLLHRPQVNIQTKAISEHEFDHALPVLDDPKVKVMYGIGFFQDIKSNITFIRPFIVLEGEITKAKLDEVRSNPERLSQKDVAVLNG